MFEDITVERGARREPAPKPGKVSAVEVTAAAEFGVRVEVQGGVTLVSFREGGAWTAPVDLRTLVRAQFRRESLRVSE